MRIYKTRDQYAKYVIARSTIQYSYLHIYKLNTQNQNYVRDILQP